MKLLIMAGFIGALGVMPVYAYTNYVEPQLDALETMYSSMDETAQDIANDKDYTQTETYKQSKSLAKQLD